MKLLYGLAWLLATGSVFVHLLRLVFQGPPHLKDPSYLRHLQWLKDRKRTDARKGYG